MDRVSPRRLRHYLRARELLTPDAIWSIAQDVNRGVFGGRGEARQSDAVALIRETKADVVYLDPPYPGTTGYSATYGPLDALLGDPGPHGAAPMLDDLLVAAAPVPYLVLSYGGPTATLLTLTAQVARHRPVLCVLAIPYPHLRSLAKEETNVRNEEYLIIAGPH